jgi:hypothetical protein
MTIPQITIPAFHSSLQPQQLFVTIFDVLGFKQRVAQVPLPAFVTGYRNFIKTQGRANTIHVVTGTGLQNWSVGQAIFSDTIILWCDDNWDAVQTLIDASAITISDALDAGWPIRGAIAYGSCVIDQATSTFVGQPIVDAHIAEQSQIWIGAALHPTMTNHPSLGAAITRLDNVIRYPVPVKSGSRPLDFAIHWCPYSARALTEVNRLSGGTRDIDARRKYGTTRAYLRQTCQGYWALH